MLDNPVFKSLINLPTTAETRHLWDIQKVPVYEGEVQTSWGFNAQCIYCKVGFDMDDIENTHPIHETSLKCLWIGPCPNRGKLNARDLKR
jgi:hypothetical protein